ncbi:MAG: hypothetical protein UV60_C0006G0058 [Parcubacteria group bacterium GW2011_GWA2_43_11]|nr:MAG: hypothetical protein UV60_C0006G0058 [Parcubacteria group bacterium GW2011_GWA2_43_11]
MVVHDQVDLWYKVLGPVLVVEKRLPNFLSNQKEIDLSTATSASKPLAHHVKNVVGSKPNFLKVDNTTFCVVLYFWKYNFV